MLSGAIPCSISCLPHPCVQGVPEISAEPWLSLPGGSAAPVSEDRTLGTLNPDGHEGWDPNPVPPPMSIEKPSANNH